MAITYELPPERLRILSSQDFAGLINDLLRADADIFQIRQADVDTTLRVTVSDGGVDASVRHNPDDKAPWIPRGKSVWQFKSGECPSANELDKEEFQKDGVTEAITLGDSYVFVTADDITEVKMSEIRQKLAERYKLHGQEPAAVIYNASHIAKWVADRPGVLAKHFGIRFLDGWPIVLWEDSLHADNVFRADPQRNALVQMIRNETGKIRRCIRIVGHAGIGKSRAVLEALRSEGLRQRVLYWPDASELKVHLFASLRKEIPNGSAILVIDECTSEEYGRLKPAIDTLPGTFRVICIGPNDNNAQNGVFELNGLETKELSDILSDYVSWPEHQRNAFVKRCQGSPKLVVLLGEELKTRGTVLSWKEIEESDIVLSTIRKRFPQIHDRNRPEAKVMRGIAMFSRLGWMDDVANEFDVVMHFFDISQADARLAVGELMRLGIVSKRGRYLYPSPDVLANILTRDTLSNFPRDQVLRTVNEAGSGANESFAERLRQLGEFSETREVVEQLVGASDFFRDLTTLEDARAGELIRVLLPAFPSQLVFRIETIIGSATRDQLRQFRQGRREIIWSLQELAWYPDHFQSVVSILRDLAVTENETWANNATGVLTSLFQVALSGTSLPFDQRLPHLERMLEDRDPEIRLLGVACLSSALKTQFLIGPAEPVTDLARAVPSRWSPRTYSEWSEALLPVLPLLDRVLVDGESSVAQKARDVLWARGADLMKLGLITEWANMAEKQVNCPFEQRRPGVVAIADQLLRNKRLSAADRERLELVRQKLVGGSYGDRLKQVVSAWGGIDYGGDEARFQADIETLAIEAFESPTELLLVAPWLFSGAANSGFALGKVLGRLDKTLVFFEGLISLWKTPSDDERALAGYLAGLCEIRGESWLEAEIERWPDDVRNSELAARMIWHVLRSPRAVRELERRMKSRLIGGDILGRLVYGFWARNMEPAVIQSLLFASTHDTSPAAQSGRLGFLAQYLIQYPDRARELTSEIWLVLEESSGVKWTALDDYNWVQLALLVVESEPVKVARLVVQTVLRSENHMHDSEDLLSRALEAGGWQAFTDVIAPLLLEGPVALLRLEGLFDSRFVLGKFDPARIVKWIEEDKAVRLSAVAHATPMNGGILSPLGRVLLIRFGNDTIGRILAATARTGSFSGSHTAWIGQRRDALKSLLADPEPNVRRWAETLDESLKSEHQWAKQREEEEGR